jgi:large subunit ribosomal protein L2
MGKSLIQQKRGKGASTWRANGFNSAGDVKFPVSSQNGVVTDIITSRFHTAPLLKVQFDDATEGLLIAPEGVRVGDAVQIGASEPHLGATLTLGELPEGSLVYNVESRPGDGGKFARGSGVAARVLARQGDVIMVMLPSKKKRAFHPNCRASLGVVAGGGRPDKPFVKAGTKFHQMKSKNRYWPKVVAAAMNAVDHPFGGHRTSRKGRPTIAPKNAPPGRMVGMIRPRKTGRARGTRVRKS